MNYYPVLSGTLQCTFCNAVMNKKTALYVVYYQLLLLSSLNSAWRNERI